MEAIKRLSDVDPRDLAAVERVFGQRIDSTQDLVLILKTEESATKAGATAPAHGGVPSWCDVLDGMTDVELAEFAALVEEPVRLARSTDDNGS